MWLNFVTILVYGKLNIFPIGKSVYKEVLKVSKVILPFITYLLLNIVFTVKINCFPN